jgi:uncharacterized protein involved in cysteine biosynthesis
MLEQLHQILETLEDRVAVLLFITYLLLEVVLVVATIQLMVEVGALEAEQHLAILQETVEAEQQVRELQGQQHMEVRQLAQVAALEMQVH